MGKALDRPRGRVCVVLALAALAGALVVGDQASVEAREYSAYADPSKATLSVLLADKENVRDFQKKFGLSDEQVGRAQAATRAEGEKLAAEFAASEKIVAAGEARSRGQIADKIAASDYDETIEATVADTKNVVEDVVGEGAEEELATWVDSRFSADVKDLSLDVAEENRSAGRARGVSCRVWSTYYRGYTRYEVALPHQHLKFKGGVRVPIRKGRGDSISGPVKEVGPWNIKDNYWQKPTNRSRFKNLPQCVPQAAAAYYNNHNNGRDGFGRKVTNPAGLDMTLGAARKLGVGRQIQRNGLVRVTVHFPWVRR